MPDDEQEPRPGGGQAGGGGAGGGGAGGDDSAGAGAPLDQTREFAPFDDQPAAAGDSGTVERPAAAGDSDTVERPAAGDSDTVLQPAAGGDDQTAVLPPAGSWSGRAEVPTVRPAPGAAERWEQPPDGTGGRWWMPILIGIVGLLLLGILGYGLWLIAGSEDDGSPTSPTPGATARPTTRPATSAPPRTTEAPPTQAPADVEVPDLTGESARSAGARLDGLGLPYRLRYEATDEQEPGTVIGSDPPDGSRVAPGTEITLIIATAPRETEAPPTPAETPASPGGEG
jgi:hypothetical protein